MVWRLFLHLPLLVAALVESAGASHTSFRSSSSTDPDSLAYQLALQASDYLSRRVYDSAAIYYRRALLEGTARENNERIAEALNNLGVVHYQTRSFDSSAYYYEKAHRLYEQLQDTLMVSVLKVNLGILYKEIALYEKSLTYLLEASHQLEKENELSHLSACFNTLGNVYKRIGDLDQSLEFHYKALEVRRALKHENGLSSTYNNIGSVYAELGLYDSAFRNFEKSMVIKRELGDMKGEASSLNNLGELMIRAKRFDEAEDFLARSLEIRLRVNDRMGQAMTRVNLAQLYLARDRIDAADRELKVAEAMATSLRLLEQLKSVYELKVALHKRRNEPASALAYSEQLLVVKDSILNKDKAESLAEMQTRYESLKKEDRIALLEKEGLLRAVQLERNRLLIRMLGVAIVLVLIIVALVYHNFRVVRKNKKHIELLLKELHHRVKNNLQILSSLLSLQSQQLTDDMAIKAVRSSESRINAMALIHRKLYTVDQNRTVDIKEYITELIQYLVYSYGYHEKNFKLDLKIKEISIDVDKAIPLGLILNELISNAFKHAYANQPNPHLAVDLGFPDVHALNILIRDNGAGISEADEKQRRTFGMKIVHTLIKELKGNVNVRSDNGTTYELTIPI